MLSIFTPTHNPRWLHDAYQSLLRQTYQNWEWVLVPNKITANEIPAEIRSDARVRCISPPTPMENVGALKRFACDTAKGDAFVELDHDDFLAPGDTLAIVADAVSKGAGFVFSDDAVVKEDLNPHVWHPGYGWESYPIKLYGRTLKANRCFPVSPRSLAEVYFAPDHVRVWSRIAYYQAGGHNPAQSVGDDHDLMCRTYLTGLPFVHTGGCHYFYRMHEGQTFRVRNEAIQIQTKQNREKYSGSLIREWCRREKLATLDLEELFTAGWTWKRLLAEGLGTSRYGLIFSQDRLQFCPGPSIPRFMNLCYDALVPGGYVELIVPSTEGLAGNLYHGAQSFHNQNSFLPYTFRDIAKRVEGHACRFQQLQAFTFFPNEFYKQRRLAYLRVQLQALKGQRTPDAQNI